MLAQLVRKRNTKANCNEIVEFVGNDSSLFAELMDYFLGDDSRISQLTSWSVGWIGEKQPDLIKSHHEQLISLLEKPGQHNAIRRNITRIYQTVEIPEEFEGKLYDICLNLILNNDEKIAVRAFSMRVCERIAVRHSDLKSELIDAIESILPHASSGMKNRGRKIITSLLK